MKTSRRDLMRGLGALGLSSPFWGLLAGCKDADGLWWDLPVNFSGKVIIIGAGAAGLAAGYLLERYGIDFEILEAGDDIGGRVKRASDFVDSPIDIGAEWLHDVPGKLAELIDDPDVDASVDLLSYAPEHIVTYQNERFSRYNVGSAFYGEYKFKRTTWFGFLETYISANILDRVQLGRAVTAVDWDESGVTVQDALGDVHTADAVIVTVPIKVLQDGLIDFVPGLPSAKQAAIDRVVMPDGLKVFVEFSERFYPDLTIMGRLVDPDAFSRLYYDAAFGKGVQQNVLGLFCVDSPATPYVQLGDDEAIAQRVLDELDAMFDGQATRHHKQHIVQNWSAEPFVRGSYSHSFGGQRAKTQRDLIAPVDGRLYWAGEALSDWNQATVPGAMETGYEAVAALLRG